MNFQVYQLTVNEDRSHICYVEATDIGECLKICNLKDEEFKKLSVEEIVFLGWLSKTLLLIQTKHTLIVYDMVTDRKKYNIFLKDKIRTILSRDSTYFDYVVQLTVDLLEVKRYYFLNGQTEKIMSLNTISNDVEFLGREKFERYYVEYERIILKTLDVGLGVILDSWKKDTLEVVNKDLECKITVNDKICFKGSGYIDRAYMLEGYVLFSFTNFLKPRTLYKLYLNGCLERYSCSNQFPEKILNSHFQLGNIQKKRMGNREVPVVVIEPDEFNFKTLVYLHGGPDTYIRNEYLDFVEQMLNKGFRVIMVDYSGSISYGSKFYKKLFNNNGEEAVKDIESILLKIRMENSQIFIMGESFGGYLAVVSAIKFSDIISKAISINGFTDYRYQYIFSVARQVITKYFDITISKNNPIDLIENISSSAPLVFIHGEKDVYCPIKQIEVFIEKLRMIGYIDVKLIKIDGEGHYSMLPRIINKFYSQFIKEVV
ncbi:alpha/beta hydrolase family protein [Facklamia sp. P9177]|uniref:alpha/beta hydrolase family protein n=1 Tax=Facklamia sp. P9177 TaxID=3421945 RepID=UPI003D1846AB